MTRIPHAAATVVVAGLALPVVAADPDWQAREARHLTNVRQVTADFARAGEGYFSPDGTKVIFQAEEKGTGNPFYQMFVQDLATGRVRRISPGVGATTCGYFRPDGKKVIFASTHSDPDARQKQADEVRKRDEERKAGSRRRYAWDFDPHMKIYEANPDGTDLKCLTPDATTYTAEGSYSPDGKHIVYTSGAAHDCELYVMDADGSNQRQLTRAPGCYNGGPFFSPDGSRVVFRADRKEKDRLQLYVIDADGTNEAALTGDPNWVYWAPFWHPDGKHIVYTAADHAVAGRPNYDVYWMDVATRRSTRLTFAPGADVLPVFDAAGTRLMWTSSRDGRGPSQLYVADFARPKGE